MAMREHHKKQSRTFSSYTTLLSLSLIVFASFLLFYLSSSADAPPDSIYSNLHQSGPTFNEGRKVGSASCDYLDGIWVRDPTVRMRYDHTCKEIFKGWNCIASNKSNARDLIEWRWQPKECDLPPLDAVRFLQLFRDRNIGFIGDSLNRNMFVALVCALKRASGEVRKWRPVGADRGFTFLQYNLTVSYHRTNLLVRYGRWSASGDGGALESLGYREGFRVDVDVPDSSWANAPGFHDILILNTGHWWWAPSKFDPIQSPMLFFEKGSPVLPPIPPQHGLDMALRHMILFVESMTRPSAIKFFRTQSPRHFEGGDWNEGGSCGRVEPLLPEKVEQLFRVENNGTNVEARLVNQHLFRALKGSSFRILDITHMSEFRADAHPSTAGGKKHDDCMHWTRSHVDGCIRKGIALAD
ncbi:Protein trichome birefringence-like 13 [Asimina triloba]